MLWHNRARRIKRAYRELSEFLFYTAPSHTISEDAPQTFADLKRRSDSTIIVWSGASSHTIYDRPEVNAAFRAIHDTAHLALGVGFDFHAENTVAAHCVGQARRAGLDEAACAALYFDSVGQNRHFHDHGRFVADQVGFVTAKMQEWLCTR